MNPARATFKVEIPFTDHAHCIGRQGNQIQTIMSTTDTHIHFPDGNREPNGTKSNQVSISGTIPSIDRARKAIREILPLSLKFLIPPSHLIHLINDDYPLFKHVRSRYGVLVLPRPYAKTGDVFCIVRGLINRPGVAEATEHLLQVFYGADADRIRVTCQTEVSEQYHLYLQTRDQSKEMSIASIEQYTHTTIDFPSSTTTTANDSRRTSITISGSPSQVCQARKLFDLCLPILLTFEIPMDKEPTRGQIADIKEKYNVTVVLRTRKDKLNKFVTLQTQEFNCEELFKVRTSILNGFHSTSPSTNPTGLLIPVESSVYPSKKRLSPIGHERSSFRHFDTVDNRLYSPTNQHQQIDENSLFSLCSSPTFHLHQTKSISSKKLFLFLQTKNLEKHWPVFERNEIDFEKFLCMSEEDFTSIGIETFGARRRMSQAITDHILSNIQNISLFSI